MRFTQLSWVLLFLSVGAALAQNQPDDNRSLGDIARETREQKRLKPQDASPHAAHMRELIADMSVNDPEEYRGQMSELLSRQDFDGLEHAADTARSNKSRFPGGPWKLYFFYDAISKPSGGRQASDADWNSHLALLTQWISRKPQSSTARIALAEAYLEYGRKARGNGYADTVTDEGWQRYGGRAELAVSALKEAATLPDKCPYWYDAMMQVAVAQGWSKERTKALVEESISFEPSFYHVYRDYANYLQPKWHGTEGEAEAFADAISQRIGGEEGSFIYFEIATVLICTPCGNAANPASLSWPKIKEGYAALEHLYGTSDLKMNRFAFLAAKFGDKSAAKEVFARIGDNWDQGVWTNRERFDAAKVWAHN
jgi:hypothetical protein